MAMKAKGLEAIAYKDDHAKQACASAKSSFSPDKDYCTVCTPLGRWCTIKFPGCQDWEGYKEEGIDQSKGDNDFSECSDWDADLEEQDRQN